MNPRDFGHGRRIEPASALDILPIASHMRESDRLEMLASHGVVPYDGLRLSFGNTPSPWTIWVDDQQAAMLGVVPVSETLRTGLVWLLGTDLIEAHYISFLRHSVEIMDALMEDYLSLFNYVDDRNRVSIRWLKWCGFQAMDRTERAGVPFTRYEKRKR